MLKLPRPNTDALALSGNVWNRAADEIERLANLQVSPPLELTDGPAGRRLALRSKPERLYWGVVQCTGPEGTEPDFTDNRYWVALAFVSNPATDGPTATVAVTAYASTDPRAKTVAATNFFESNNATHLVRPQTIVRLWAEYDRGSPAQLRWTMIVADEGTDKSAPCLPTSSSSSSSSAFSTSSTSSGGSTSSSSSASSSVSGSSSLCPAGYNGMISVVANLCLGADGALYYQPAMLQFCNGALVASTLAVYLLVQECPPAASSSSGSGSTDSGSGSSSSSAASSSSSSASSSSSSSSGSGCFDPTTESCGGTCSDASLPTSVVVNTSPLSICVTGCEAIPSDITLYPLGSCTESFSPLFLGQDGSMQITSVTCPRFVTRK